MKYPASLITILFVVSCAPATPTAVQTKLVTPTIPSAQATRTAFSILVEQTGAARIATAVIAPPVTPQASISSGIKYMYDDGASAQDRKLIETAVGLASKRFGNILEASVYAYADFNSLCDAFEQFENRSGCSNLESDIGLATNGGGIFLNISSRGWKNDPDSLRMATVIHEYVHVVQFYLTNGRNRFKIDEGPEWLVEGSAEYLAYQIIQSENLFDVSAIRREKIEESKHVRIPIKTTPAKDADKATQIYWRYSLGYLASEFLAQNYGGEQRILKYFGTINSNKPWNLAFRETFGISIDEFNDKFEEYRRANFPQNP